MAKDEATKKTTKAKKEQVGPKKPLSAYMIFSQEERPRFKEENPDAGFGDLGKIIGAAWKEMSAEEKEPYNEKNKAAKAKYEEECKEQGIDPKAKKEKKTPAAKKPKKSKKKAESEDDNDAAEDDEDED